jgi:hypothetical protein
MSFDLEVRQQRRSRRKPCRLSKTMKRMIIGQFWQQRGSNSSIGRHGSHQGTWADTVMTPFMVIYVRSNLVRVNPVADHRKFPRADH